MDKLQLEILGLSSSKSQAGSFALVLGESTGKRRLPIIIGMFEAQAIAIEIEKITPNRPMTHDLFKSFAKNFNFSIKEIVISDLQEGVFFAKIVCEGQGEKIEVDARPSDAIAIGLRFNVPIFTFENIMSEAGIILSDIDDDLGITDTEKESAAFQEKEGVEEEEKPAGRKKSDLSQYTVKELEKMLDSAIGKENYEQAAKIRDELNKRN